MKKTSNRGFTLIELSVVVTLMAIFAAVVVPNLVRAQEGQQERAFFDSLRRIAIEGRTRAIDSRQTVTLRYDESTRRFELAQDAAEEPGTQERARNMPSALCPAGVQVSLFRNGESNSNASDWEVVFYPDGRATPGGIEMEWASSTYALQIDARGTSTLVRGNLTSESSWEAGELERRL